MSKSAASRALPGAVIAAAQNAPEPAAEPHDMKLETRMRAAVASYASASAEITACAKAMLAAGYTEKRIRAIVYAATLASAIARKAGRKPVAADYAAASVIIDKAGSGAVTLAADQKRTPDEEALAGNARKLASALTRVAFEKAPTPRAPRASKTNEPREVSKTIEAPVAPPPVAKTPLNTMRDWTRDIHVSRVAFMHLQRKLARVMRSEQNDAVNAACAALEALERALTARADELEAMEARANERRKTPDA